MTTSRVPGCAETFSKTRSSVPEVLVESGGETLSRRSSAKSAARLTAASAGAAATPSGPPR